MIFIRIVELLEVPDNKSLKKRTMVAVPGRRARIMTVFGLPIGIMALPFSSITPGKYGPSISTFPVPDFRIQPIAATTNKSSTSIKSSVGMVEFRVNRRAIVAR